jgi:inner membrane transporter RhtA
MATTLTPVRSTAVPSAAGVPRARRRHADIGAVGLVLGGMLSVQFGSAVAALLFPRAGVAGVVTLRLGVAAVVLLAVCRPRLRGYGRRDWALIGGFGVALAGMNSLFYQAIDRIPLGLAVTLEVLGPLVLSVLTFRRAAGWLWAGLALTGVALLGQAGLGRLDPVGVGLAFGAGGMWAAYIVFSGRVGSRFPKLDGLALAMTAAALMTLPQGVAVSGAALMSPPVLALGAVVALLSSILPYTLELTALRRMPTATFAVLMSLGPAVASLAGYLVLRQPLSITEALAITLVIGASVGAVRTPPQQNPPTEGRSGP